MLKVNSRREDRKLVSDFGTSLLYHSICRPLLCKAVFLCFFIPVGGFDNEKIHFINAFSHDVFWNDGV